MACVFPTAVLTRIPASIFGHLQKKCQLELHNALTQRDLIKSHIVSYVMFTKVRRLRDDCKEEDENVNFFIAGLDYHRCFSSMIL